MAPRPRWVEWHDQYENPQSSLSRRRRVVQRRLEESLSRLPPGRVRLVSMCAGSGSDVLGVLAGHPRRADVTARLVELDPELAERARLAAQRAGLTAVEVVAGDASSTSAYAGAVPADVVMVCGVFGNIADQDIHATVGELPGLCAPGATIVWTRHRRPPDLTPTIRGWFADAEFEEVAFDTEDGTTFGVGTHRYVGDPPALRPGRRLFTFTGDRAGAGR